MATLEERVAALEAAVAGLGPPETLQPNYLTVDATGLIGADFTGHIHAEGLDLDAPVNSQVWPESGLDTTIRWLRTADGGLVAQVGGSGAPGGPGVGYSTLEAVSVHPESGNLSRFALSANGFGATVVASIHGGINPSLQILDEDGLSGFVQLVTTARRAIDFGSDRVTWPGGGNTSTPLSVAHGLTRVPLAIIVQGTGSFNTWRTASPTNVSFTVEARTSDGAVAAAGAGPFFYWIAIG